MYFVEFHTRDLAGNVVPACGDRSVIVLDGRNHAYSHHTIAQVEGKKRGYPFYKLCRGESFTRVSKRTGLHSTGV